MGLGWLLTAKPELWPWPQTLVIGGTPRERLLRQWEVVGFDTTALGRAWLDASAEALRTAEVVDLPLSRTLYFALEPRSYGFRVELEAGRQLAITFADSLSTGAALLEVFAHNPGDTSLRLLTSRQLHQDTLVLAAASTTQYVLRLEVPPLSLGAVAIRLGSYPQLSTFPVQGARENDVGSVWGDARDGGRRRHEGIDIFAPRGTPLLAAAEGRVSRVRNRGLGGKQVWLRVPGAGVSLYYAHLDSQYVVDGQRVRAGDTVGTVGNTGNARSTPPHLHFGIYGPGGAVDPFPFVRAAQRATFPSPQAPLLGMAQVGRQTRLVEDEAGSKAGLRLSAKQLVTVTEAASTRIRVVLPSGEAGWLRPGELRPLESLETATSKQEKLLYQQWAKELYAVNTLARASTYRVLARDEQLGDYVRLANGQEGWLLYD